ncbi:photosystem II complex extrinsic protein PsbU [Lusitaniella coriacea LEGE 07157]|uniref:Photosystem II extrinsic protein U n=1 Tax=Lusitaniella coriacea LEGE 07157 TaxID=945747 RepID=A0A8J7E2V7_9CYAN|nr:photosystem II complex extrinsic protein PsbU [Lusitaniella coriacea]MBE9118932.1 photosystem II complex extrinsic protein PsbU [Lusitaniella coriacea LEGE 07157]
MRRLIQFLAVVTFVVGGWAIAGQQQAFAANLNGLTLQSSPVLAVTDYRNPADAKLTTEFGQKIDLNNSHVRDFRSLRGFYPNLAGTIIQNAPYKNVEDVLDISGLSESQKKRLQANLDLFTVTDVEPAYVEGGDRFNPGVY